MEELIFSQNGSSWKLVKNENVPYELTYADGLYVGFKWKGKIFYSKEDIRWQQTANLKAAANLIIAG
ncbi:MAG: hypothetical protein MK132_22465 [Lentisphaerales bacterium]|nr:hypothetical protein [Lentisphaerales bacterium]